MINPLHRASREDGAQAVEFAIVASVVLLPLMYAIVGFGMALFTQITASHLAREVARSAAICLSQPTPPSGGCAAVWQAKYNYTKPGGTTFDPTPVVSGSCTSSSPADGSVIESAVVTATPPLNLSMFGVTTIKAKASTPCGG